MLLHRVEEITVFVTVSDNLWRELLLKSVIASTSEQGKQVCDRMLDIGSRPPEAPLLEDTAQADVAFGHTQR